MRLVLPAAHHTPFPAHTIKSKVSSEHSNPFTMTTSILGGTEEREGGPDLPAAEGLAGKATLQQSAAEGDSVTTAESSTTASSDKNEAVELPTTGLRSSLYRFPNGWSKVLVPTPTTTSTAIISTTRRSSSSGSRSATDVVSNILLPVGLNLHAEYNQCKKQLQEVTRESDELKLSFEKLKKEKRELQARLEEMNHYQKEKIHDLTGENLKLKLQLKRFEIQQLQLQKSNNANKATSSTPATKLPTDGNTHNNSNNNSASINAAMSKSLSANRATSHSTLAESSRRIKTLHAWEMDDFNNTIQPTDDLNNHVHSDTIQSQNSNTTKHIDVVVDKDVVAKDKEVILTVKINPFAPLSAPFLSSNAAGTTTTSTAPPSLSSSVNPFASFTNSFLSNLGSKSIFQPAGSSPQLTLPAPLSTSTLTATLTASLATTSSTTFHPVIPSTSTSTSGTTAVQSEPKKKTMAQTTVKMLDVSSNSKKRKATAVEATTPKIEVEQLSPLKTNTATDIESLKAKLKRAKSPTANAPSNTATTATSNHDGLDSKFININSSTTSFASTAEEIVAQVGKKPRTEEVMVVSSEATSTVVDQVMGRQETLPVTTIAATSVLEQPKDGSSSSSSSTASNNERTAALKARLKRKTASTPVASDITVIETEAAVPPVSLATGIEDETLTTSSKGSMGASVVNPVETAVTATSKLAAMKAKLTKKK